MSEIKPKTLNVQVQDGTLRIGSDTYPVRNIARIWPLTLAQKRKSAALPILKSVLKWVAVEIAVSIVAAQTNMGDFWGGVMTLVVTMLVASALVRQGY
jgi:Family of unknown function (DUF6232)